MAAWRRSGQGARTYAARAGVSAASLHRWSSLSRASAPVGAPALVEVVPTDGAGPWAWELELGGGTLRGRAPLEAATAKAIVEALGRGGRR